MVVVCYLLFVICWLLNAEACAKTGDEAGARKSLKAIMALRVPDASYIDALTGKALLDEIYLQTRIELWGEGKSYLSLKRNKGITNRGSNHLKFVGTPIPHNDTRLTFKIPIEEVQNLFLIHQNQTLQHRVT